MGAETIEILRADEAGVATAAGLLRQGAVIAFPTDTVYGLAALARDRLAIRSLYEVKGRPLSKPPVLMVAEPLQVADWAHVDARARSLMDLFWPGPLTLVLRAHARLRPPLVAGSPRTVGVRIPAHPVALALLREVRDGLATTSANESGSPEAVTALEAGWLKGVAAVLDGGRSPGGRPSTVLDVSGSEPRVLREGPIPAADLLRG